MLKNMTHEFCKVETETLKHLFCDCPSVKNIWQELEVWLRPQILLKDTLAAEYMFLSARHFTPNGDIINLLLFSYKEVCICDKISQKITFSKPVELDKTSVLYRNRSS